MGDYGVFELRNYEVEPARREEFIEHFRRHFVHAQEAEGMGILGYFRVVGRPDRFVWLRAFTDLDHRLRALRAFYGGEAWRSHKEVANDIMGDFSNVLLLQPAASSPPIAPRYQPDPSSPPTQAPGAREQLLAGISHLDSTDADLPEHLQRSLAAVVAANGARELARLVTEPAVNDFPALPVREETVAVGLLAVDAGDRETEDSLAAIWDEVLRLEPGPGSHLPDQEGAGSSNRSS